MDIRNNRIIDKKISENRNESMENIMDRVILEMEPDKILDRTWNNSGQYLNSRRQILCVDIMVKIEKAIG